MLTSPQKLEYKETLIEGPCVSINFPDTESPVDLPVAKVIRHCCITSEISSADCFLFRLLKLQ